MAVYVYIPHDVGSWKWCIRKTQKKLGPPLCFSYWAVAFFKFNENLKTKFHGNKQNI